jgi:hypothetical protein
MHNQGKIFVGIGGWNFAPWRGVFYPKKLPRRVNIKEAAKNKPFSGSIRQLLAERYENIAHRTVENPWKLFARCSALV